ncbi:hypothetical protein EDC94DRAFT_682017 [Helicostylum pulchrum]|nr:hypothetical protein EDC94DRAFT_682017 [Helicostylum pulchrum]
MDGLNQSILITTQNAIIFSRRLATVFDYYVVMAHSQSLSSSVILHIPRYLYNIAVADANRCLQVDVANPKINSCLVVTATGHYLTSQTFKSSIPSRTTIQVTEFTINSVIKAPPAKIASLDRIRPGPPPMLDSLIPLAYPLEFPYLRNGEMMDAARKNMINPPHRMGLHRPK